MSLMKSSDDKQFIIDCNCGCGEGLKFVIDKEDSVDYYCLTSFISSDWYNKQKDNFWQVIYNKLKRIWFVLRDKDYQYSEFYMSKNEFCEFKEYIDSLDCEFKGNEV